MFEQTCQPLLSHWVWDALARNWALVSMVGTLVVLVAIPVLILRKYVKIVRNILGDAPAPMSMRVVDFEPIEGEPISFPAFDGHALAGMLISGAQGDASRGLIVFAHEYLNDAGSCARYCRPLLEAGYDIMTFDFRGHGRSGPEDGYQSRQWPSDRERADMLGAIAYAENHLEQAGRPKELGLFGISRGAGAAVLAAVEFPSVKGIVTDGAFSTDTTLEHLMKRWATIFAKVRVVAENHPPTFWRFLRWLALHNAPRHFGCRFPSVGKALVRLGATPILLIHGEKDGLIPVMQSQLLYDVAAGPKELWIAKKAKHNQSVVVHKAEYAKRIVDFFDKHLKRRAEDSSSSQVA